VSSTLTYVYCLVRATGQPSLRRPPAPVPGGRSVRLLEVPLPTPKAQSPKPSFRHWLVVSSVPARQYDEAALERGLQRLDWVGPRALAHEAVVEHFLSSPAVLPMQLFALFTTDARAIEHVASDRRRIARILARIEGRVEWGLRVTLSRPVQGSDPAPSNIEGRGLTPFGAASGAEYLARKRELRDAPRLELQRARADAARAYHAIRRTTAAARRRTEVEQAAPGSRVILDAAFLVPAGQRRAFEAAVRGQTRPLERTGLAVSLTGPWPAYNFI
jgi:hypothetical protein